MEGEGEVGNTGSRSSRGLTALCLVLYSRC